MSIYNFNSIEGCLGSLKNNHPQKMTFESIGEFIDVSSRTKVKKIFKGQMKASKEQLNSLCELFGLTNQESDFLNLLRAFNECSTTDSAILYLEKIVKFRKKHNIKVDNHTLLEDQLEILSDWFVIPLWSYLGLSSSSSDTFQIIKHFKGQISTDEVIEGLRLLSEKGLIKYSESGAILRVHNQLNILDGLPRELVRKYHDMMIEKAKESIEGMPQDKRFLMGNTINLSESMIPIYRQKINNFLCDLTKEANTKDADAVYQLNMQFFNIATTK